MKCSNDSTEKTFLRTCAFIIMALALAVAFVVLGYSLGMEIPGLPRARPIHTYFSPVASYFNVLFPPIGSIIFILIGLRPVLKRKIYWGIRPEFFLIGYSLVAIAGMLLTFGNRIQYGGNVRDLVYSMSLVPIVLATVALLAGYVDRYLRGKSVKQHDM